MSRFFVLLFFVSFSVYSLENEKCESIISQTLTKKGLGTFNKPIGNKDVVLEDKMDNPDLKLYKKNAFNSWPVDKIKKINKDYNLNKAKLHLIENGNDGNNDDLGPETGPFKTKYDVVTSFGEKKLKGKQKEKIAPVEVYSNTNYIVHSLCKMGIHKS